MRKMIKRYICILAVLFGTMGYGQGIDGSKSVTVKYSFSTGENKLIVTVAVADFLQTMPVQLYTPPPITAPTINIQEILNNPSSSEEDKAKAHEALAIQQAQEAQAAAAMAQMQSLIAWLEAQSQALAQSQAQTQAQAQAQAEAFLGSLQQVSQSIANGGTVNTNTNTNTNTTVTWYFDNDGDGYHSNTANTKIMSAPGWKTSTSGLDCDDNDPARTSNCTANLPTIPWFLDNDNDGYFAIVQPGTRKPTTLGNWTSVMTKGPDCDDTNPAIGICSAMPSLLNYYIDYDGDGYDSGTITSTTSLGAPYKTSTKGKDCNDNIYSADNSVCSIQVQGTNTSNPGKDYVPKSTDKLVRAGIVTTCDKQSKLGVCVLTSLEVTLNNVLGLAVTSKEITTAAYINTLDPDYLENGLNPAQTIKFINSFCITEALTKNDYKTAIDAGKTFITDIKTGVIDNTTIISHSVSVIGYDVAGNYIYIDPALGKAQVALSSDMGFSYSIIIKGKK